MLFEMIHYVLGGLCLIPFIDSFQQLNHVRRMDAEEDFCLPRSGLDPFQVRMLLLRSELSLKCQEGLPPMLRSHTSVQQSEILRHLPEREKFLYSAKFTLAARRPIEVIEIKLGKRKICGNLNKMLYFSHAD